MMDALKDHIIETQNKMYAAEGSGDLEEFRRLNDYRNGLMDALKLVESPWTYLITPDGEDTGERPPLGDWLWLSYRWKGVDLIAKGFYDGAKVVSDDVDNTTPMPITFFYAWKLYQTPDPAPYPMEEK